MSIINYIGNTPIVKILNPYGEGLGQIYVKVSGNRIEGSVLEETGGNTGIGN